MTRHLLLLTLPALALSACGGTTNRGLETVHQPVVASQDYALDLQTTGDRLSPGEAQRLSGWFATMRLGYGDRVAVDDGGSYARGARDDIQGVVARSGLLLADATPVASTPVASGTIRVVVSRMSASVPGCSDWSRDGSNEFDSNTSSNHGCAINPNLAAMIANPGDLVLGREGSALSDPRVNYRAIDAYRKATPTGQGGTAAASAGVGGSK